MSSAVRCWSLRGDARYWFERTYWFCGVDLFDGWVTSDYTVLQIERGCTCPTDIVIQTHFPAPSNAATQNPSLHWTTQEPTTPPRATVTLHTNSRLSPTHRYVRQPKYSTSHRLPQPCQRFSTASDCPTYHTLTTATKPELAGTHNNPIARFVFPPRHRHIPFPPTLPATAMAMSQCISFGAYGRPREGGGVRALEGLSGPRARSATLAGIRVAKQ